MGFENLKCHEALRMVLPKEVTVPTGFETVGTIAHMNLDEEHMPFKFEIGEIFLRKNL
jgi:tRNA (guanine37-N1)-methyltransferase